jgi:hypothetical protein
VVAEAVAWLCRSPRRLAVGAATILVVLLVGGSALFGNRAGSHADASDGTPGRSAQASASAAAQVPNANPYIGAALAFVRDWSQLKKGETAAQWQARLAPLSTPDLAAALRTTDPAQLPGVGPDGEPVVRFVSQTSALIAVPLADSSSVLVTVVTGETGPLVSDIQPNAGN